MAEKKKVTISTLYKKKQAGEKIAWITAYDYPTAQFADAAGVDMILVGDSLGMCVYGYPSTIPVTMEQCLVHCEAVRRGAPNTFVVGDMPFLSYQSSLEKAIENAGRFLKEASVDAVKTTPSPTDRNPQGWSAACVSMNWWISDVPATVPSETHSSSTDSAMKSPLEVPTSRRPPYSARHRGAAASSTTIVPSGVPSVRQSIVG